LVGLKHTAFIIDSQRMRNFNGPLEVPVPGMKIKEGIPQGAGVIYSYGR